MNHELQLSGRHAEADRWTPAEPEDAPSAGRWVLWAEVNEWKGYTVLSNTDEDREAAIVSLGRVHTGTIRWALYEREKLVRVGHCPG